MRLLKTDWKSGEVRLEVSSPEDLWTLNQIIEPGDSVTARTLRKIKIGEEDERSGSIVKKPVTLSIDVTKVQLAPERDALRVSGTVTRGPEDVTLGSYHTISVEMRTTLTLRKDWLSFQKDKLTEATKEAGPKILMCIHDREEAIIAETAPDGHKVLAHLHGQVAKKSVDQRTSNFYAEISKALAGYVERKNPGYIIIASPAFWKEELMKELPSEMKEKTIPATCSSVSENAISEVLHRQETRTALQMDRLAKESQTVESFLCALGQKKPATYGPEHVALAAEAGAVKELLITDKVLSKHKEEGTFGKLESIMKSTEKSKGRIHIIGSSHDAGKRLDGIGGIAAILRFQI